MRYTIVLVPDDGQISVRVPALPGLFTWGRTRYEAIKAAREAIALYLEDYVERGQPFPRDRKFRGKAPEGTEISTLSVTPGASAATAGTTHQVA